MWSKSCYRKCIWNAKRAMANFMQGNRMMPIVLRYVIMTCIPLHKLCIELADPFQSRWKLEVQELAIMESALNWMMDGSLMKLRNIQ